MRINSALTDPDGQEQPSLQELIQQVSLLLCADRH